MEGRYTRLFPAITEADHEKLRASRVCIVGCGGLGGYVLEYLARLGVGAIHLVDGDAFDETNLNRQLLCTVEAVGRPKVEVAAERVAAVNPDVEFSATAAFLDEGNCNRLISGSDIVIDALDGLEARLLLEDACARQGIALVHGAVCGWSIQVAVATPGNGLLHRLYPKKLENVEKCCMPFTPPFCASVEVAQAVELLCGRHPELENRVLIGDVKTLDMQIIEV